MTTRREEGEYVRAERGKEPWSGATGPIYEEETGTVRARYEEGAERMGTRYREGVEHAGERTRVQGEQVREGVARGLHNVAERLRGQGMQRGQESAASRVAQPLERTSEYLGSHSLSDIQSDAMRAARDRPLLAAAGVFAAAFLVGRLLRRR